MAAKKKVVAEVNLRRVILDTLKPLLPKAWRYVPYGTALDTISTTVVMLALDSIERLKEAPQSHRQVSYTLSVIDPSTNFEQREDTLDDSIIDLLNAIDDVPNLTWSDAKRGLAAGGQNLGFDITLTFPFHKLTPDPEGA